MSAEFEHCIRCTLCVENCPVFKVNPAYPGPKQAGPDSERFRLSGNGSVDEWIKLCTQCKRCEVACPYGVNPAETILKAQLKYADEHGKVPVNLLFANNHYLGILGSLFAPIANLTTKLWITKKFFNLTGIATYLSFPKFYFRSLSKGRGTKNKGGQPKVVFFHGCFLNNNQPALGRAMIELLTGLGIEVVVPRQICCGLPALGNGDKATARRMAKKNTRILTGYIDKGYDVIYACTSCGLTLMHDYPGILAIPGADKLAENVYNLHEYILKLIEDGRIAPEFQPVERHIAYHVPCHLRAAGQGYPAVNLLRRIPGLKLTVLDDNCCGLSGSYGFKLKNAPTAIKLGQAAAKAITDSGAEAFISDCGACRMQLGHFSKLPALDPSEILMDALGKAR